MEITKAKIWTITYVTHFGVYCDLETETQIATSEERAKEIREYYIEDIKSGLEPLDLESFLSDCPTNPDALFDIKFIETYGNSNSYQIVIEEHSIEIM